ncbi:myocardin-related transcription factor B-like [Uloborus diversus]|uniref:myocardin-related transcription factor B-like n=1 Tax=Uloborus diversus TaxID=327109 RepID=UPI00240A6B0B|nr:myocardin-related transcription factor B-like [Uloborus diversus]
MNEDEHDFAHFQNMTIPCMKIRDSKSPPKAQVDAASLLQAMDKNKESLKVKLMTRRPINQLVEQGIIPSLKVPPHFHEQVQKLERAKTGDFLKNKIQRRPDRQALIQQHILEDTKIDPSLQDKQRQLKKARLADDLNDRLSHRPGPLELVKGNILHADEKFAQALKEGQIPFKRTCEGQALRNPAPSFIFEDDSGSDVALSPPQDSLDQSLSSMPSVETMVLSPYQNQDSPTNSMGELRITTTTPPSLNSPVSSQLGSTSQAESTHKEHVTTVRTRKKSKPKAQPKTRTIKFHEYKGPPSAQKNQASNAEIESSYDLLLQQQQLFLQWQLEWQQKYPHQMILPQPPVDQSKSISSVQSTSPDLQQDIQRSLPQNSVSKFEDLKVNDLKAELKKRNLPVSGSKPQLIERLKKSLESSYGSKPSNNCNKVETTTVPLNVNGIILDTLPALVTQPDTVTSVVTVEAPLNASTQIKMADEPPALMVYNAVPISGQIVASRPSSAAPMDIDMNSNVDSMDCTENTLARNENIVKLQQKKIQQLQRELQRSQMKLQQQQWLQHQQAQQQAQQQVLLAATQPVPIAPAPPNHSTAVSLTNSIPQTSNVDAKALQKLQQHLQQKFQQQQLLQQLQQQAGGGKFAPGSPAMSAAVKANLAAFIHNQQANSSLRLNGVTAVNQQNILPYAGLKPIVLCPAQTVPAVVEKPRANSLPNGIGQQKLIWTSSVPNFSNVIAPKQPQAESTDLKFTAKKNPPDYTEATKLLAKIKQEKPQSCTKRSGRKSVKSQAVDDVLEILIKNGELPPSAAQEPPTPTTPETQKACSMAPSFPSVVNTNSPLLNDSESLTESQNAHLPVKSEPSARDAERNSEQNPPIVFDLHLELQDIEAMDLGVLDRNDAPDCVPQSAAPFSELTQQTQLNCPLSNSDMDMDVELPEWLDVLTNNNPLVSSTNLPRSYGYNSDPLLPSMSNGQDTLDMFSLDDLDFKTATENNILSWDKVDYAT